MKNLKMLLKVISFSTLCLCILIGCNTKDASKSGYQELDSWAEGKAQERFNTFGYPVSMNIELKEFYEWYLANNLESIAMNNVGDPYSEDVFLVNAHHFEREVISYFASLYHFESNNHWGIITNSGTDGNNHGIYFGVNYLQNLTGKKPVMYVSDEAHYSNMRLADLQNLDLRLVKSDDMGRMIPQELEKVLDPTRPCLIVYAMGSTFKGAIDDIRTLNGILAKHPKMAVYRHLDAALFGGYLPFTKYSKEVDRREIAFESIAVSGHKFFGMDDPAGFFITTRDVYDKQAQYNIAYLNADMKMINCSRSTMAVLKFWWLWKHEGENKWKEYAENILECTSYMKAKMDEIGWPCWVNPLSNTIFFKRPCKEIIKKYSLACSSDERFGGELSHVVVMQHVTKERIDAFIQDLVKSKKE